MFEDKVVTVFPTYGYRRGDTWTIPFRVWLHKRRSIDTLTDAHVRALLAGEDAMPLINAQEIARCRERLGGFVADSDSSERVVIEAAGKRFVFPVRTDANGLLEGECELPGDRSGVVRLTARVEQTVGRDFEGVGTARLVEPEGKSVISDIDDTVKVTEVPAGPAIVLRNTFVRDYVAVDGMVARFRQLGGVPFHYVSGSPWQLFGVLQGFLSASGYPDGTFHMKSLRTSPLDLPTFLQDLKGLVLGKQHTKVQKIEQISSLMSLFPGRTFTLVGDSGELDPEVFTEVREKRGRQVEKIVIRDVVDARTKTPGRLHAVDEVIDAPFIGRGRSQFV